MAGWSEQPLAVKFSLLLAILGLLGTALFVYELPALISARSLRLECDSLGQEASTWQRLRVELMQLQGREQRLRTLLATRMNLAVDSTHAGSDVGRLLLSKVESGGVSSRIPVINPVRGVVSREFDPDAFPIHGGVDIAGDEGDLVVATANGTVIFAGWSPEYGNMVILLHRDGFVTRYGHLKTVLVEEGETLFQCQTLGELGSTGFSSAPHLHYEIWQGKRRLDPRLFLQ
jgi:murein DD-endopeptidase MepM/ murein hydrolase activator NlpD